MVVKKLMPLPKLLAKCQTVFNRWVRERDSGKKCISCGSYNIAHASHYYPVGMYSGVRFDEDNVHASCISCNTYKHGNLHEYRLGLLERIGKERLELLDHKARIYKLRKWHSSELEELINKYGKQKRTVVASK
jgi:hypothetical protein